MSDGNNKVGIGEIDPRSSLIEENRRLSEAQALGHIGDFYFDTINNSVTWSDELYRIMGVPVGEPMDFEKAISFYIAEDRDKLVALATECMTTRQPFEMEAKFLPFGHTEAKTLFLRAKPVANGISGIVQDITSQKKSELEVLRLRDEMAQRAEDRFKILFNSMDEGYCIIQMMYNDEGKPCDWRYLEVNPAFERHNGLHNATGKTIREFAPDIEQKWMDRYNAVAETGESIRFEEDSDALHRIFDLYAFRISMPEERQVAVLFTDITARRNAEKRQSYLMKLGDTLRSSDGPVSLEQAVTEEAMRYFNADRCYYCSIEDGNAVIARDAFNDSLSTMAGTYPLVSYPLFKAVVDLGKPFVVNNVLGSTLIDDELRRLCVQLQVISFVDVPVKKDNRVVGMLCLVQSHERNWTDTEVQLVAETAERTWAAIEQAKAEETLRRRERELARVQEIGNIGGVHIDVLHGLIGERSPEYLRIHGLPADLKNETHQDWLNRLHPADRERAEQTLFSALNSLQTSYENEYRIIRPSDGQERWIYAKMDIERTADGKPARLTGVHIDITGRKLIEEALRNSEQQLKGLVKLRDEFIGVASHELRTPVTSIKTYGQIVEESLRMNGDNENTILVERLNNQVRRLTGLISHLLDVTRIEEGRLMYSREVFSLNDLLKENMEEMQYIAGTRQLVLHVGEPCMVRADRERIGQVLTNLISNAIKYSPDGTSIIINSSTHSNEIKVSVADKGIGIPADSVEEIFQRFYRVGGDAMSTYPGMGLGLYISAEIIKNHGGKMEVRSNIGEGSVFSFTLPFEK